jgi:hypothetical protein
MPKSRGIIADKDCRQRAAGRTECSRFDTRISKLLHVEISSAIDAIPFWRRRAAVVIRSETLAHPGPISHEDVAERRILRWPQTDRNG